MRSTTLFLAAGILALVFGLGFLVAPAALLPLYGVATDPPIILMSRFFGVALAQLGLALYLIREVRDAAAVRALALAGVVGSICGIGVSLIGVQSGVTNALGWSTVAIYVLLALGYVSCLRAHSSQS
jgi:hypothetical protein